MDLGLTILGFSDWEVWGLRLRAWDTGLEAHGELDSGLLAVQPSKMIFHI